MALNSVISRAASVLPVVGIVLALANWYARPERALGWAAALAMLVVMITVLNVWRLFVRRSKEEVGPRRALASITSAVVFGALMIVIPLATSLAFAYGAVDDPDVGQRATMILLGAFLVVTGNTMSRTLPPLAQMRCDGARIQTFQRRAGWIWVLSGVTFTLAWLTLPVDIARAVSMTATAASVVLTIALLLLLRLRGRRQHSPLAH